MYQVALVVGGVTCCPTGLPHAVLGVVARYVDKTGVAGVSGGERFVNNFLAVGLYRPVNVRIV